jgi:predicted amidohydrolase YtcJ
MNVAFVGGSYIARGGEPRRGGVATRGREIVAVGADREVIAAAGPGADVVDSAGKLVSAGFIDAHLHPIMGGRELGLCNLTEARSQEQCLDLIAAYVAANPEVPWIQGGGWTMDHFPGGTPRRELLDAIVPDRPVLLRNRDHHGSWANSAALRVAGITADTPDPRDGRIERDPDGAPTGSLHEGATMLVAKYEPEVTTEDYYEGLLRGQEECLRLGITGWQDALLSHHPPTVDMIDAYKLACERGTLRARVTGAILWDRNRGTDQLQDIVARSRGVAPAIRDWFRADSVKFVVDGVVENFSAAMSKPYLDPCGHTTDNRGMSFLDAHTLKRVVAAVDRHGLQAHFHAIGDRAVTEALDAVEHARRENPGSRVRHHLAHVQVVLKHDIPRFAQLDAAANIQPLWARHEPQMDELTLPFIAEELAERQYPFRDLLASGARLVAGSDWPVSSASPIEGIHVAVNRTPENRADEFPAFLPDQRIPLSVAWEAYTEGSAYVNGREDRTGRLAPGFLADLVVLDRNPFDGDPLDIATSQVESTWVDGDCVYERG